MTHRPESCVARKRFGPTVARRPVTDPTAVRLTDCPPSKGIQRASSGANTVIPFPATRDDARQTGADRQDSSTRPADRGALAWGRLERAIAGLQDAIDHQRSTVAVYRQALGLLQNEMTSLEQTTRRYGESLAAIDVQPLRQRSLELVDIAEGWQSGFAPAGA